jgi:hypothetical protein
VIENDRFWDLSSQLGLQGSRVPEVGPACLVPIVVVESDRVLVPETHWVLLLRFSGSAETGPGR